MGLVTAITIFIALVIDFLFLPPLLIALDKRKPLSSNSSAEDVNVSSTPDYQLVNESN
jgi:hypothetical protein